jgi:hypothetical protein
MASPRRGATRVTDKDILTDDERKALLPSESDNLLFLNVTS